METGSLTQEVLAWTHEDTIQQVSIRLMFRILHLGKRGYVRLMQQHANIVADGHHRLEGAGLNIDSTREVSSVET